MGWGVVFVLLFMTQNKKHDLNSWLNLGVDFNPGSPKYGEMVRVIEGKLENLAAQDWRQWISASSSSWMRCLAKGRRR